MRTRDRTMRRRAYRSLAVFAVLLGAVTYWAFAKQLPFSKHYEVNAIFSSATELKTGNPVRVSGLDVGKVLSVRAYGDHAARVTMEIDDRRGLHENATAAIRPRLFFEGNFYVDLRPGTPAARPLREGATIPLGRTSVPVQIDQVLSTLTGPVRRGLRQTFGGLSDTLRSAPDGTSGSASLRLATDELVRALPPTARTLAALDGTRPGDAGRAVRSSADLASQVAADPKALGQGIANFDRVFAALAARDRDLSATLAELVRTVRAAPGQLSTIDAALPATDRLVEAARPVLRQAPETLPAATVLLRQVRAATSDSELGGLLRDTSPAVRALPGLETQLRGAAEQATPVARCVSTHVVPVLNSIVDDGKLSTGRPVWQDFIHLFTALAGTSPNFDGNGTTIRLGVTESELALAGILPGAGRVVGQGSNGQVGVRPVPLGYGVEPAWHPEAACSDQALPDLHARNGELDSSGLHQERVKASARSRSILKLLMGGKSDRRTLLDLLAPLPRRHSQPERAKARPKPAAAKPTLPAAPQVSQQPKAIQPPKVLQDVAPKVEQTTKGIVDRVLGLLSGRKQTP